MSEKCWEGALGLLGVGATALALWLPEDYRSSAGWVAVLCFGAALVLFLVSPRKSKQTPPEEGSKSDASGDGDGPRAGRDMQVAGDNVGGNKITIHHGAQAEEEKPIPEPRRSEVAAGICGLLAELKAIENSPRQKPGDDSEFRVWADKAVVFLEVNISLAFAKSFWDLEHDLQGGYLFRDYLNRSIEIRRAWLARERDRIKSGDVSIKLVAGQAGSSLPPIGHFANKRRG